MMRLAVAKLVVAFELHASCQLRVKGAHTAYQLSTPGEACIGLRQAAYMKILESSQTLLHVLKRETVNLTK